jgi:predicted glycoside hydrolase/deacetylase ChbG (UPF0249 family)
MKQLIVNADDFGLTAGVTAGIVETVEVGVVCSSTAMACFPGAEILIRRYAPALKERIGAHLQLTSGTACLPADSVPSLIDATGLFPLRPEHIGPVNPDDVYREWRAQVERLRSFGVEPTHLDTHHHIHGRPDIFPAILRLGRELQLPVRTLNPEMTSELRRNKVPCAELCVTAWFNAGPNPETLLNYLDQAFASIDNRGVIELMTHPGHCDPELQRVSTYAFPRETEMNVLTSARLIKGLKGRGIMLHHW